VPFDGAQYSQFLKKAKMNDFKGTTAASILEARLAIEKMPRATTAENALRASRLKSTDQLGEYYATMRRADYCDVVAEAVKARNFSDRDAGHALYTREWVRSGGALRMTFPDWMESEAREHILALNTKWLASGLRNTSFHDWLTSEPLPAELTTEPERKCVSNRWAQVARTYDDNDPLQFDRFLLGLQKIIYDTRNEPDLLAYYASFVCGVAVTTRELLGIDVSTLMVIVEPTPLGASHPLTKVLPVLDKSIGTALAFLGNAEPDDHRLPDIEVMLYASFIWKGYLLALNTYPDSWNTSAICALSALHILTKADPVEVRSKLRNEAHLTAGIFTAATRKAVLDSDWPPRGFVDIHRKHGDVLEQKCHALFGALH
jgi:hypothetical protein